MTPIIGSGFLNKGFPTFSDAFGTDGALGIRWAGSTWTVAGGVVTNAPATSGSELLTNGSMEADANWANYLSPTTNERSNEQAHAGTYSRKIVADSGKGCNQSGGTTAGRWYRAQAWLYTTAGSAVLNLNGNIAPAVTAATWTLREAVLKAWTTYLGVYLQTAADASTFYADDASLIRLDLASLFASVGSVPPDNVIVSVLPSTYAGMLLPCGIVANLDSAASPANFILATYGGSTYPYLYKCVAGTYTTLVSTTAVSCGATSRLGIYKVGTSVSMWYGGAQVGTTQTISDVPAAARHGIFSTHAGNQLAAFCVHKGPMKIVAFLGDSITSSGATQWSHLVPNSTKYGTANAKNHAAPGNSIIGSMDAQTAAAATDNADVIFVALGTNDNNDAGITAEYQENLVEIAGTNANAKIYCLGIWPKTSDAYRAANNTRIQTAVTNAAAAGVNCTYWNTDGWIDPSTETSDGLHPTTAGHIKIRDRVLALLP
jgi:lysophospholipase L1-like esterase